VLETVFLNDLQAFFGFMSIIMIGHKPHAPSAPRVKFQNSYWILKITIFLFFLGISTVIPNIVFIVFGYASFAGGVFFIFVQILVLGLNFDLNGMRSGILRASKLQYV